MSLPNPPFRFLDAETKINWYKSQITETIRFINPSVTVRNVRFAVGRDFSTGLYQVSVAADCEQAGEGEWAKYPQARYVFVDDAFKALFDEVAVDVYAMYAMNSNARNSRFGDDRRRTEQQQEQQRRTIEGSNENEVRNMKWT